MFEYKRFDILEVAEKCGISLNSRTLERSEVEAWCPFCPTESSDNHLYLNKAKERFYCQKCSASGNSVSLYARVFGISNKEAAERLSGDFVNEIPKRDLQPKTPCYDLAPLARRHDVYYDMLRTIWLSTEHRKCLQERGLSDERIEHNMYRSMPFSFYERRAIAGHLAKRHDLRGVPGFYYSKHKHWELCGKSGILIPICDADGYIQGVQIRLDNADKKKYRWLSSNPDYGFPYGTPSSVWVHVTGNRNAKEAYITEGGLKGDVASYLSGDRLFICTAGVSSIQYLYDVLKSLNVSKINGCYDMDQLDALNSLLEQRKNPFDSEAYKPCPLEKMEALIRKTGVIYERRVWPREHNGIDEYYLDWLTRENRKAA